MSNTPSPDYNPILLASNIVLNTVTFTTVATATGASSPLLYNGIDFLATLDLSITQSIEVQLQGSHDGSTFFPIEGELPSTTAAGETEVAAYTPTYLNIADNGPVPVRCPFNYRAVRISMRLTAGTGTALTCYARRY